MKKFQLVFIMVFLQISFVIVGLTEIQAGHQLLTPYIDSSFAGSISGMGNSYNTVQQSFNKVKTDGLFNTQPFQICILTVCTPTINLPGFNSFGAAQGVIEIFWNLGILLLAILVSSVLFAGIFYTAIIQTLLPAGLANSVFPWTIGLLLGLIQMIYIMYQVLTTVTNIQILTSGIGLNWHGETEE